MDLTCVMCAARHANTWKGEPGMYCESCSPVREAAKGTVSHIVGSLYLSDMLAASTFEGFRMCVHEEGQTYEGQCHFLPILVERPVSKLDRTGALASTKALDRAANLIDYHVTRGEKLVVHCQGGIERSPLTIAWYLTHKVKQFATLSGAYAFIKQKRPVISNRLFWLPESARS
jgi:hypothetical protein